MSCIRVRTIYISRILMQPVFSQEPGLSSALWTEKNRYMTPTQRGGCNRHAEHMRVYPKVSGLSQLQNIRLQQ